MIIVRLTGGLGNQLFQYATARRAARYHDADLALDLSWYRVRKAGVTPRQYELARYNVAARPLNGTDLSFPALYRHRLLKRLALPRPFNLIREKGFFFDPRILHLADNAYLDGYWQSPKYFDDARDALLAELTPREPMSQGDQAIAGRMAETESVSIHVRRGDYVTLAAAAKTHGLCTLDYYRSAVAHFQQRLANPTYFVFSDDPEWTRTNLRFDAPMVFVNHNGPEAAFQDLRLMSLCSHQIIANSSFSWWAAWLNRNPQKIVVAPEKWFSEGADVTAHLYPESWVRI